MVTHILQWCIVVKVWDWPRGFLDSHLSDMATNLLIGLRQEI